MLELSLDTTVDLARSDARHGWGCFETCRIQAGAVRWLPFHLARMATGCGLLGLQEPPGAPVVQAWLEAAGLLGQEGILRLLAVDGRLIATVDPMPEPVAGGQRVALATSIRRHPSAPGCRAKLLNYAENRLLHLEAQQRGCLDVIALNTAGRLTDGGRLSLFLVRRGRVLTPAAAEGALPGVARRVLLEAGLAEEASLGPGDLEAAEGILMANALRGGLAVKPHAALLPLVEALR